MQERHHRIRNAQENEIFVYSWQPDPDIKVQGVVQIIHGLAEAAERYARLAAELTARGYAVYACDLPGHGRTAGAVERVGILGPDGFAQMTDTVALLMEQLARREHPQQPLYVLGHSMGSFIAQQLMYRYPALADGVVLSGTNGKQGPQLFAGIWIAAAEAKLRGGKHRSKLLNTLTFGGYNRPFRPNRTAFDWLSRDAAEVDAYIRNPYCGAVFCALFFRDFLRGLAEIHRPSNMARIPKQLPLYVFGGDRDPVGGMGRGVQQLLGMYARLGLTEVSSKLYPQGRHEMLNETNRAEVTADLLSWLDAQTAKRQAECV
ncbi:alpha/beta hydrolase [Paenibacillus athensensis]|uniref:Alpha/beta hydrolase n=1 Tax=Paenibacillus athensensis TaxID=1967502 RepID=A0A4Y8QBE0_9BACL|nr:alpha/beta hydrolase [Paenibacillus athensensis]MCD1257503.1 alpha/beta hydrolase [Paenibacillus athensensis]